MCVRCSVKKFALERKSGLEKHEVPTQSIDLRQLPLEIDDYLEGLHSQFDNIVLEPGHTFTVLEVEPLREKPGGVLLMMLNRNFASAATSRKWQGSKSSAIRHPSL